MAQRPPFFPGGHQQVPHQHNVRPTQSNGFGQPSMINQIRPTGLRQPDNSGRQQDLYSLHVAGAQQPVHPLEQQPFNPLHFARARQPVHPSEQDTIRPIQFSVIQQPINAIARPILNRVFKYDTLDDREDLIICMSNSFQDDTNRWKRTNLGYTEVFDYRHVKIYGSWITTTRFLKLKRLKVCQLPADVRLHEVLYRFSVTSLSLQQLEIHQFDKGCLERSFNFKALQVLSIDKASILEQCARTCQLAFTQATPGTLKAIFLGKLWMVDGSLHFSPTLSNSLQLSPTLSISLHLSSSLFLRSYFQPSECSNRPLTDTLPASLSLALRTGRCSLKLSNLTPHMCETITYVNVNYMPTSEEVNRFPNLETLVCHNLDINGAPDRVRRFFERMPVRLTELRLNVRTWFVSSGPNLMTYDLFINRFDSLMLRIRLQNGLRIFVDGVQLNPNLSPFPVRLPEAPLSNRLQNNLSLLFAEQIALRPFDTVIEVRFFGLDVVLRDIRGRENRMNLFFWLFPNVQHVTVSNCLVENEELFLEFLRGCRALTKLTFCNTHFQRATYQALVELGSVQQLHQLALWDDGQYDFDSLTSRLPNLRHFETNRFNHDWMAGFVGRLAIQNFRLSLHYGETLLVIRRKDETKWYVEIESRSAASTRQTLPLPYVLGHMHRLQRAN